MISQDPPEASGPLPPWLQQTLDAGFIPYVATSKGMLSSLNLKPYGVPLQTFVMDDHTTTPFLEAYLLSNSLSFNSPDYKMPNWVCVDCVLVPEAIVGFMAPLSMVPSDLLAFYRDDPSVDLDKITHIPVSGQIDTCALDESRVNFSLFSLGRRFGFKGMGLYTKALSLEAHGMRGSNKDYRVILQYDNLSMKVHGRVSPHMMIEQPMVPLHPSRDMTLVICMKVDFDPKTLESGALEQEPTFWLEAQDKETKKHMHENMTQKGYSYEILPPYAERRHEGIFIPVLETRS